MPETTPDGTARIDTVDEQYPTRVKFRLVWSLQLRPNRNHKGDGSEIGLAFGRHSLSSRKSATANMKIRSATYSAGGMEWGQLRRNSVSIAFHVTCNHSAWGFGCNY